MNNDANDKRNGSACASRRIQRVCLPLSLPPNRSSLVEAPEEELPKSLYEQLKANRDKQEAEEAEAKRLSACWSVLHECHRVFLGSMVRGLENDEFEFLDKVAKAKRDEENSKRQEEERLFEEMRQRVRESFFLIVLPKVLL